MSSRRLLICGPRSVRTVTGVALAVDLLIEGLLAKNNSIRVVDATCGGSVAKSGAFSLRRAWETVCVICLVWWHLLFSNKYYATMSTSSFGFIRDYLTIGFATLLGHRTVFHLHGGGFEDFYTNSKPWLQCLIRENLRRVDTVVVLGELLKEQFYCVGEFVKPKLVVVPNGLTLGVEEPVKSVKSLTEDVRIELLYLSSLMPSKGFFDVIQAMQVLEAEMPRRYHLNLCGSFVDATTETAVEVHDEASLIQYIQKHELEGCVTYHGQVRNEAKGQQLKQAHVFLLPTSYLWEGQPLSIIEALAFSTPVISCYHKGVPELIESEKSGLFVEPGSPALIAEAVLKMTANESSYEQMSRFAREHYEAKFKREVHLEKLIGVIYG